MDSPADYKGQQTEGDAGVLSEELPPSGEMDTEDEAQIELRWNELPRDLDLYVFISNSNKPPINYANRGTWEAGRG